MKNLTHFIMGVLLVTLVTVFLTKTTIAQDPVEVAPETYKVLLENERVRVLEIRLKPGGKSPMHSHPAFVIYSFSDSKAKFTTPDGKTEEMEIKAGETAWSEAVTHAAENVGTTEAHVLNIELKEPPKKMDHPSTKTAMAQDPVKVAPEHYKVLLENERVRVLEFRDKPGEKVGMHSHPDYIIYAFGPFKRKFTFPDGKTNVVEGKAGDTIWAIAEMHAGENIGTTDTHVLLIELKEPPEKMDQPQKMQHQMPTDSSTHSMNIKFQDIKWEKMFPEFGEGSPEIAILHVDPKTQATQLMIRVRNEFHVPKHWHTGNETHTVISGTFIVKSEGKREELGPGSFNYMPAKMVHEAWIKPGKDGYLIFITVDRAWDVNWVDGPPKLSDVGGSVPEGGERSAHVMVMPSDVQWTDAPPSLPPGAQMALLEGDPKQPGPFTIRFKAPAGYKVPPHWHPADEHVTVISGTLNIGIGDKLDPSKGKKLTAGSFMLMPAKMHHFAWTKEETIIQVHGIGPWGINYVNPEDDPRNKSSQ